MKTVLIIGPDFAPSSLPPALRIRFFANHLSEFGWKPIVLAVKPEFYETETDLENERLVDDSVEVLRVKAFHASWTRRLGIGDLGLRSLWQVGRRAYRLCSRRRVDLVFIPVPPYFTMVLGRLLRARFDIPYVVDYIDPWIIEDYWKLPVALRPPKWAWADAASRWLEPFAVRSVSHVVGVSQGTVDRVRAPYPWIGPGDVTAIPYGGEPADFDHLQNSPRENRVFDPRDGLFHLTYTGAFIPGMHATAKALFEAFRAGLAGWPDLFSRLRIHFVGTSYSGGGREDLHAARLASEAGVGDRVTESALRVPYLSALQILMDSDGLLAVGSDAPHYTASKLFPYLLAGKPILAVFHESSSVVSILRETRAGVVVTYGPERGGPSHHVAEIAQALRGMLTGSTRRLQAPALDSYTTREMARRLASVFDGVASATPPRRSSDTRSSEKAPAR